MEKFFFCGAHPAKLDDKNRFVLPQSLRYGLVENGELNFSMGIGVGGCLTLYKRSEINALVQKLRLKMHNVKYQRFFTLFFSTLHHTACDKLGRVLVPPILKAAAKIECEIVIAGVLNRIEIWSKTKYDTFFESDEMLFEMMEDLFSSEIASEKTIVTSSLSHEGRSLAGLQSGGTTELL